MGGGVRKISSVYKCLSVNLLHRKIYIYCNPIGQNNTDGMNCFISSLGLWAFLRQMRLHRTTAFLDSNLVMQHVSLMNIQATCILLHIISRSHGNDRGKTLSLNFLGDWMLLWRIEWNIIRSPLTKLAEWLDQNVKKEDAPTAMHRIPA